MATTAQENLVAQIQRAIALQGQCITALQNSVMAGDQAAQGQADQLKASNDQIDAILNPATPTVIVSQPPAP